MNEVVGQLGIALGLGLLVGLQREWSADHVAGIRTFALITVFGALAASFADAAGAWIAAAGLVAVAAVLVAGYVTRFTKMSDEPGLTTVSAALVMYGAGVAIGLGREATGVVVGGGTAVLLHWKQPLHGFVQRLGEADVRGIIQLVLIALVILPVLPRRSYGPYDVLVPFEIWLMVVLIVGISVAGYILSRFLGARTGTLVGGMLGGLISSTATTVGYSRRSAQTPKIAAQAAVVILIASTVVFLRVMLEIAVVAPEIFVDIVPPLVAMMVFMAAISWGLHTVDRPGKTPVSFEGDPADLKAAIVFGSLYAAVLLGVAAAREHLGPEALYLAASLSGLTDMDAITLSTAQLIKKGQLPAETGWRMILVGAISNLAFKGVAVALLGHPSLFLRVGAAFGLAIAGAVGILVWWP